MSSQIFEGSEKNDFHPLNTQISKKDFIDFRDFWTFLEISF
jgi:hypothetical protein